MFANSGDIRDAGLIPGSGRSPGGGHGNPLQHSCLENPMDKGAWRATVQRVTKSDTFERRQSHNNHKKHKEKCNQYNVLFVRIQNVNH